LQTRARRSLLYVPADKPRALEKARSLDADAIILDLEDAVAPSAKAAARDAACAAIESLRPREVIVRINALVHALGQGRSWQRSNSRKAGRHRPAQGARRRRSHRGAGGGQRPCTVWAMIESPRAVLERGRNRQCAGVAALILGSNDLLKDMGARHMPGRANLTLPMSQCVLAARAAGIAVLDGVHNDLADTDGFVAACIQARDFGFDGKTLVHPDQIAPCNAAFTPSPEEVAAAQAVVAAFAAEPGAGVIALDGRMIERLDVAIAERLLARARMGAGDQAAP
jgi:citrate lyase subunit beta/citryl-CoA lyase